MTGNVYGIGRLVVRVGGDEVDRRCVRDDTAPELVATMTKVGMVEYVAPGDPARLASYGDMLARLEQVRESLHRDLNPKEGTTP